MIAKALNLRRLPARDQTGVALLQVLLLSAVMSLLAIRFTETARDQLEMVTQFENRVQAQLLAHSAMSEVIFLNLSQSMVPRFSSENSSRRRPIDQLEMSLYGVPTDWGEGVIVKLQDVNGLLPQMFPQHPLWTMLLARKSLQDQEIRQYLGVWSDIQDSDTRGWSGDSEPIALPTGQAYLNRYAQNKNVIEWVFHDRPKMLLELLEVSDVYGAYDTNPGNYPSHLLYALLNKNVASAIIALREQSDLDALKLQALLPLELKESYVVRNNSGKFKLEVIVRLGTAIWREEHVISLSANSNPPFRVLLKR